MDCAGGTQINIGIPAPKNATTGLLQGCIDDIERDSFPCTYSDRRRQGVPLSRREHGF